MCAYANYTICKSRPGPAPRGIVRRPAALAALSLLAVVAAARGGAPGASASPNAAAGGSSAPASAPAASVVGTPTSAPARLLPLSGTFYQPSPNSPLRGDPARWDALFSEIKALGMDTFIIQWSTRDSQAFYDSALPWVDDRTTDVLRLAFAMAGTHDIGLHIGLAFSDAWWKHEKGGLKEIAARNREIVREIKAAHLPNPRFKGWYIPQEVSNYTTTLPDLEPEIRQFLIETARLCDMETPGALLSIAPYFNPAVPDFSGPDAYAAWWGRVAGGTGLDIVMLQDGVGANRVPFDSVEAYFRALGATLAENGMRLWSDLEVFRFEGTGKDRVLLPARFELIRDQIRVESPLVDKIVCFAYPNYMFTRAGEEQAALHDAYKDFLNLQSPGPRPSR